MRAKRKICSNAEERTVALNHNDRLMMAGEIYAQKAVVPKPIWTNVDYRFRLEDIVAFWLEEGDICVRHLFEGVLLFEYETHLVTVLDTKFATN